MSYIKNIAAFFDIDGTLYREGLITEMFKKLIKYDIVDPKKWYEEVKPKFIKWDNRVGEYDDYLQEMADIYIEAIKGLDCALIEFIAKQVVEQKGGRVYTFTRDRILWHKEQNHKVITISGSPIELVKEMSLRYNMDDYRGSIHVCDKKRYVGQVIPMWDSKSKKKALDELVNKYNIDLENSYAYGDTAGDFSMLKAVGNPFCINPTKELIELVMKDESVKKKIKVVVERKDMIYYLDYNYFEMRKEK
ncbi:HAD-IB family hydrolase [Defluviitalea phaphyphila]|uniref:HAD-IB family hydrolase n=1 Tax=Defluviitalea phaphyphila TaxID=1473580 RepID=UPI000B062FF3|nr:HAD-IB family hydrolase [Defluviitalea phaphyphila]